MTKVKFVRAAAADASQLLAVQIRAFHDDARLHPGVEIGGPPGYDSITQMLEDIQTVLCFAIIGDDKIIGGIVIFERENGHYHLDRLFIDPVYHNRGIGTQALQFIEATFAAKVWTLDTPVYATRNQYFYEKAGYVKVGEGDDGDVALIAYEKAIGH